MKDEQRNATIAEVARKVEHAGGVSPRARLRY